jgi:hypothetical protein
MTKKDYILFAKKISELPEDTIMDKERLTLFIADIFALSKESNFKFDRFYDAALGYIPNPEHPVKES